VTPARTLLLLVTGTASAVLLIKAAQVAFTPELYAALCVAGRAVASNVVVQALVITLALVGIVSACAAAWDYEERTK
jgi:hypothetical protein